MAAWKECLLGDVLNLKRGYDLPHSMRSPGPFPVVSSSGITDHHSEAKVQGPGVVTGRYGTLGQVFYVETDFWPLNTSLYVQDFKGNDPRFISYFLGTLNFGSQNAAGAVPGVNRNHLHALNVRVPPLPIQQRIAGILSAYDELIENSQRRIKILETMARALYREWFVNFRFPGHESAPRVPSPLGEIPQGWEVCSLGDFVQFKSGFAFKSGTFTAAGEHRLVTIKNVQDGAFNPESDSRMNVLPEKLPPYCVLNDGDILLSLTGNVGRVCLVYDGPFLLNQRVAKLAPVEAFDWAMTYCMFREPEMRVKLEQLSNGVAQQNLSPVLASKMDFICPPRELRKQFAVLAEPMVRRIVQLYTTIQNLRRTRDLLLPRLLSGQIEVEALPS
jgi:type I restriction enzyme, S subunit